MPESVLFGFVFFGNDSDNSQGLFVGFEFSMESLILAQDERWRRA